MSQQINRDQYRDDTPMVEAVPVAVPAGPVVNAVNATPVAPSVVYTDPAPQAYAQPAPPVYAQTVPQVVVEPAPQVVVEPAPRVVMAATPRVDAVRTAWSRHFAPDAVIAAAVGVVLLLIGLIAVTRGGFDGPMSDPVVEVLGFNHTTTLGIIEIVIGVALLIAGVTASRAGAQFFGGALAIAAVVGAVQPDSFRDSLALESGFAWLMVLLGVLVVATSLLLPRYNTRSTTVNNTPF